MPENGNYVTRGEFNIVYDELREIKGDVKKLLRVQAMREGGQKARSERSFKRNTLYLIAATIFAGLMGAIGSVLGGLL